MKFRSTSNLLFLALLLGALALMGCDRGDGAAEEASGEAPAATETAPSEEGEAAAAEGEEAAEAPAAAAPAAAAAEAPALAEGGEPATAEDIQLVGTWSLDVEAALEANDEMSAEEREMMRALFGSMQMSLSFAEGNQISMNMTMMGETQREEGTYEILSRDGDSISVRVTPAEPEEGQEPDTMNFRVVDSNTLVMEEDGQQMFLRRTAE